MTTSDPPQVNPPGLAALIIDDDPLVIRLFRRFFVRAGFRVETATDGQRGLELIRTHKPDVVLLDVRLPVLDGFEVLRRMREEQELVHVPVVCFSGFADKPGVREETKKLGALDCIMKGSMPPDAVIQRILQLIGKTDAFPANS